MFKDEKEAKGYIRFKKKNLERLAFIIIILVLVFAFAGLPKICEEKYSGEAVEEEVATMPIKETVVTAPVVEEPEIDYEAMVNDALREQRVELGKKNLEELAKLKNEFQSEIDYLKQQLEEKAEATDFATITIGEVTLEDKGNDMGQVKSIVVEIDNQKSSFKPKIVVFVYDANDSTAEQNLADANIFLVEMPVGKATKTMNVDISEDDLNTEKTIKVKLYDADTDELLDVADKTVSFI